MDASAFVSRKDWEDLLHQNHMDEVDIRDNRYNQVSYKTSFSSYGIIFSKGSVSNIYLC